jgi:hypothetical protein
MGGASVILIYLDKLPDPVRTLAIHNYVSQGPTILWPEIYEYEEITLWVVLKYAFNFYRSPQGFGYWMGVLEWAETEEGPVPLPEKS